MKTIVYSRFGTPDVLQMTEAPKPVPGDDEVLVRVHATTVTSADWRARSRHVPRGFGLLAGLVFGFSKPKKPVLGNELAGDVEAVGKDVTRFKPGDKVFAHTGAAFGCYVEYKCLSEDAPIALIPSNLTYEEAAALSFGGTTALAFLTKAKVQRGDKVLVNGACGTVGTAAVQIAKHLGAEVTGVCSSGGLELVRSIGADHIIDYTREDFTRSGEIWDVIIDTVGNAPYPRSRRVLAPRGRLLAVVGSIGDILRAPWIRLVGARQIIAGSPAFKWTASQRARVLSELANLAASGQLRPIIDRRYPFERIVEAHRYVDTGHKHGSVAITVAA
jgi:NADPH:quinone reductase-like Zn-dependent oxidoreductase